MQSILTEKILGSSWVSSKIHELKYWYNSNKLQKMRRENDWKKKKTNNKKKKNKASKLIWAISIFMPSNKLKSKI